MIARRAVPTAVGLAAWLAAAALTERRAPAEEPGSGAEGGAAAAGAAAVATGCGAPGEEPAEATGAVEGTTVSASAALGVGAFGSRPATSLELGLDVARGEVAFGLGGRVRLVVGEGARGRDWDEPSEGARVLRYLTWSHPARSAEAAAWSFAIGSLAGVRLGRGEVVAGYTAGLDVDHGRSGLNARVRAGRVEGEALLDDLAGPRLLAGRVAVAAAPGLQVSGTAALDLSAPAGFDAGTAADAAGDAAGAGSTDTTPVAVLAIGSEWSPRRPPDGWSAAASLDLVGIPGAGAGVHPGLWLRRRVGGLPCFETGLEARLGTSGYLPGWFSPLYELERERFGLEQGAVGDSQWRITQRGGLGGVGFRALARLGSPRLGEVSVSYEDRAGTSDLFTARLAAPGWRAIQAGAWVAAERAAGAAGVAGGAAIQAAGATGSAFTGVLAAEARVRLPRALFVALELARLYRHDDGEGADALAPLWVGTVAVGAVVGE